MTMLFIIGATLTLYTFGVHSICGQPLSTVTAVNIAGRRAAIIGCAGLPGQFEDPNSDASHYIDYLKDQGAAIHARGSCQRLCRIDLLSNPINGLEDVLGGLRSACESNHGSYHQKLASAVTARTESDGDAHGEKIALPGTERRESNAICTEPITSQLSVKSIAGIRLAFITCSTLSGQLNEPDSNAGRYVGYVQQGAKCIELSSCGNVCRNSITNGPVDGLDDLLLGLKSECEKDGGTYREKLYPGVTKRTEPAA